MEKEKRINELEENIKAWREELNTVWQGKDTDAAEVEKRNLRDLINNAEREIDQLKSNDNKSNDNKSNDNKREQEVSQSPEDLLEELKNGKENDEKEKRRLNLSIEKLEEEKEAYASQKNTAYKDIYKEYEDKIKGMKEELEKLEKKEIEGKDEKIKILTQGRMKEEEGIREIEKQIREKEEEVRQKQQEIADIEYGTEKAMEEKELSDGTKTKVPKVLNKYKELDEIRKEIEELKKSLGERTEKKDEYQKYINVLKGIEKEEKPEYTAQQNAEYTKYFHGQGDIPENTRDDRRANDEYSGFEKPRDGKKPIEPVGKDPEGKTPPPSGTDGKDPKDPKNPKGKGSTEKDFAKIQVIEINEENGNIFFKDTKGETGNMDKDYAFISKDQLMRKLGINEKCREIAGGRIRGSLLKRKLNPEILMVLEKYPEQCEEYIRSIKSKEKTPFDLVHNLEGARLIDKLKMNKYVRAERKSGTMVLGGILSPKISEGIREKAKAIVEGAKQQASTIKKNDVVEKIDNKDNHIEKNAVERIQEQSEQKRAKEVQSMMEK